jgi:hypothetical protein
VDKTKHQELNPFDLMGGNVQPLTPEEKVKQQEEGQALDRLIHQTFVQTESGRRLLAIWKRALITNPVLRAGEAHDPYDIGHAQGTLDWIRHIIITCENVDKGDR